MLLLENMQAEGIQRQPRKIYLGSCLWESEGKRKAGVESRALIRGLPRQDRLCGAPARSKGSHMLFAEYSLHHRLTCTCVSHITEEDAKVSAKVKSKTRSPRLEPARKAPPARCHRGANGGRTHSRREHFLFCSLISLFNSGSTNAFLRAAKTACFLYIELNQT